jgi:hypothetical protein
VVCGTASGASSGMASVETMGVMSVGICARTGEANVKIHSMMKNTARRLRR